MRSINAAPEKERSLVFTAQLLADPATDRPVAAELFVGHVERRPIGFDVLPRPTPREVDRALGRIKRLGKRVFGFGFGKVLVPRRGIDEVMQQLTRTRGVVTVIAQVSGQEDIIGHHLTHVLAIVVQPRNVRCPSGEHG